MTLNPDDPTPVPRIGGPPPERAPVVVPLLPGKFLRSLSCYDLNLVLDELRAQNDRLVDYYQEVHDQLRIRWEIEAHADGVTATDNEVGPSYRHVAGGLVKDGQAK